MSDQELLRQFADDGNGDAFRELVRRHVDMVYGVCRRQLRDAHLAEDVTQAVFVILAEKAKRLIEHPALGPWLHRTAVFTCANARQLRQTRRRHEQQVTPMTPEPTRNCAEWEETEQILDEGLLTLPAAQRAALVLRYFDGKSVAEIAGILGVTEYAVEKSQRQGLARLKRFVAHKGVTATLAGLTAVLAAQTARAAPLHLAARAGDAALAASAAGVSAGTAVAHEIARQSLRLMALARLKAAVAAGLVALATVGIGAAFATRPAHTPPPPATPALLVMRDAATPLRELLARTRVAIETMNVAEINACVNVDSAQRPAWDALVALFAATERVKGDTDAFFGPEARTVIVTPTLGDRLNQVLPVVALDEATWTIDGDQASVRFTFTGTAADRGAAVLHFIRVGGHNSPWQIDLASSLQVAVTGPGDVPAVGDCSTLARDIDGVAMALEDGDCRDVGQVQARLKAVRALAQRTRFKFELADRKSADVALAGRHEVQP